MNTTTTLTAALLALETARETLSNVAGVSDSANAVREAAEQAVDEAAFVVAELRGMTVEAPGSRAAGPSTRA